MTVESVSYIDDLNPSYPAAGDPKSEGDDHIRNIKTAIRATFPNITSAMTCSESELNVIDGSNVNNADLVKLHAVTASAAELNITDGLLSTTAELNRLAGTTFSASDLNTLVGAADAANAGGSITPGTGFTLTNGQLYKLNSKFAYFQVTLTVSNSGTAARTSLFTLPAGYQPVASYIPCLPGIGFWSGTTIGQLFQVTISTSGVASLFNNFPGSTLNGDVIHVEGFVRIAA